MPDNKNQPNRIPHESITHMDKWTLPRMEEGGQVVAAAKKARGHNERIEDVTGPIKQKPLTAEHLRQITEEAEKEGYQAGLEKGVTEGLQQGAQQGRQQAYQEASSALEEEKSRLQAICLALMEPLEQQDSAVENTVVDIALGLAKHILCRELSTDISSLYNLVHQTIKALPMGATNIRIFLHPDDAAIVEELFVGMGRTWQFLADNQLERGGCRVESNESVVDYSVERRLADYLALVADQGDIEPNSLEPPVNGRLEINSETSSDTNPDASLDTNPDDPGANGE